MAPRGPRPSAALPVARTAPGRRPSRFAAPRRPAAPSGPSNTSVLIPPWLRCVARVAGRRHAHAPAPDSAAVARAVNRSVRSTIGVAVETSTDVARTLPRRPSRQPFRQHGPLIPVRAHAAPVRGRQQSASAPSAAAIVRPSSSSRTAPTQERAVRQALQIPGSPCGAGRWSATPGRVAVVNGSAKRVCSCRTSHTPGLPRRRLEELEARHRRQRRRVRDGGHALSRDALHQPHVASASFPSAPVVCCHSRSMLMRSRSCRGRSRTARGGAGRP